VIHPRGVGGGHTTSRPAPPRRVLIGLEAVSRSRTALTLDVVQRAVLR
jgi:hypothetical protein